MSHDNILLIKYTCIQYTSVLFEVYSSGWLNNLSVKALLQRLGTI